MKAIHTLFNVLRGAMIGIAEIIPGVSGGTIALIVGVYEALIESAGHLVRGVVRSVSDGLRRRSLDVARTHFRQVQLGVVIPVVVGMFTAVILAARFLAPLIEEHPIQTQALFAGLIIASLIVPIRMVGGRWTVREIGVALLAAVITFLLTSIPSAAESQPSLWVVALAAAFAICALVLPGVSGSFLLVTVGLYAPTLAALNNRDLPYIGAFIAGAVLGLSLFVSGLQWLLENRHRITLVVITGLMLGSLRALWPWQTDSNALLAPGADVPSALALFAIGIVVVLALIALESVLVRRRTVSRPLARTL
jgi:putative membrane protein